MTCCDRLALCRDEIKQGSLRPKPYIYTITLIRDIGLDYMIEY